MKAWDLKDFEVERSMIARHKNERERERERERESLLYPTAEEGHCDLAEIFILVSFHLYMS